MNGWTRTAKGGARIGRTVVRAHIEAAHEAKHHRRGRHTEQTSGPVWCRVCGCRVRSGFGDVCPRPRCQRRAVA